VEDKKDNTTRYSKTSDGMIDLFDYSADKELIWNSTSMLHGRASRKQSVSMVEKKKEETT